MSGDAAGAYPTHDGLWLIVADGLGHGPIAHKAATTAVEVVKMVSETPARELMAVFQIIHERLTGSIGAAVALGFLEVNSGKFSFVGVGNISLRRLGASDSRLVSRDGIVGQRQIRPRLTELTLTANDLLLVTSDGVSERFGPEDYPGLRSDSVTVIARTVVERFGKLHDDATCLALRFRT